MSMLRRVLVWVGLNFFGLAILASAESVAAEVIRSDVVRSEAVHGEIIRGDNDDKQYRYLELDNRLRVLLVSDPDATQSAAALDVHVGSGSDPEGWLGLAHFLEHLLFLGTEKYPHAGAYQSFINERGGSHNAYTSFDHTNYFFSISPPHFEPALDRFSRFFIDPTFDALFVSRERQVVHAEYQARKKEEGRRLWDAQKRLLNPAHAASRFAVGCLHCLRDRDVDDVDVDVDVDVDLDDGRGGEMDGEMGSARARLMAFYKAHYSANIMTLAVVDGRSLDQLEAMVRDKFSAVKNYNIAPQAFDLPYFNLDLLGHRLDTVPLVEVNSVAFYFPVPSTKNEYRAKPLNYIANLLGHEGEGSVLALLRKKGLAISLSAGAGFTDDFNGMFNVRVGLTQAGLEHIDEVGAIIFQGIALIDEGGVAAWRYEEQARLSEVSFRFASKQDAGRLAQSLSARMQFYAARDVRDVLYGAYRMDDFDAERIHRLLGFLRADNVAIQVTSKRVDLAVKTDLKTEYYAVDYGISPINAAWLAAWAAARGDGRVDGRLPDLHLRDLHLPEANVFVPERLDRLIVDDADVDDADVDDADEDAADGAAVYRKIGRGIEFWYYADGEFAAPRGSFYANIMSPVANHSAVDAVLTELYVRMVNNQLNKVVYPAYLADLSYSLYRHGRGISLRIDGFEDRQSRLLEEVVAALKEPQFADESRRQFAIIKDGLRRELENSMKQSPSHQAIAEVYRLLVAPYWVESERLAVLAGLSLEDLQGFVPRFFERVKVRVLSHGDVSEERSIERVAIVEKLFVKSEFIDAVANPEIVLLGDRSYLRTMQIEHSDSALARYFQGRGNSLDERAMVALLLHFIESPFYHQLRTLNRVGYLVHAVSIEIDKTPGLLFSVQSSAFNPLEINAMFDDFLLDFRETLRAMSADEFMDIRAGLLDRVLDADKNLAERSARLWREIDLAEVDHGDVDLGGVDLGEADLSGVDLAESERSVVMFDSRERFALAIENIGVKALLGYFDEVTLNGRQELLVQAAGGQADVRVAAISAEGYEETGGAVEFKLGLE